MKEQMYKFVDMTGRCFKSFQEIGEIINGEPSSERRYHNHMGAMLRASNNNEYPFGVGDMMAIKADLVEAGFEWGVDFYVKKIQETQEDEQDA